MSSRDALRALSRRYPLPEQIASIINGPPGRQDRETAIVTGALVESCLERAIIKKLRLKDPNLIGQLFKNRGPLTDFHSKILIGQAIDVADPLVYPDLRIIKDVRNAFAHSIITIDFSTPEVKNIIESSEAAKGVVEMSNPDIRFIIDNPTDKYLSIVRVACYVLGFSP